MKKIRVVFVSVGYPPNDVGGAEKQCKLQAEHLASLGHDIQVVTPRFGYLPVFENINGIKVYRLPRPKQRYFGALIYALNLFVFLVVKSFSFDLIHVHLANLQAEIAVISGKIRRKPVHIKIAAGGYIGDIARTQTVPFLRSNYGIREAASVQAISEEIFRELMELGLSEEKVVKIPNGVLIPGNDELAISRERTRLDLNLSEDVVVFLYLGRISTYKGIDVLLEAWKLRAIKDNSHLYIVGPVAIDAPYEIRIDDLDVTFIKGTNIPLDYLAMADVYVSPSLAEGMSNSLLEAMSCEKAIIATRVGAAEEMIEHNRSGILIEAGNVTEIKKAIDRLTIDFETRHEYGTYARITASRYDIKKVIKILENRYVEILEKKP